MHYIFATRGEMLDVERLMQSLNNQAMLCPCKKPDGSVIYQPVYARVEPIQLWSYVFPKEYSDAVLNTLGASKENQARWYGTGLKNQTIWYGLRKALWCKPIPQFKTDKKLFVPVDALENISIMPIGVKYDVEDFKDDLNGTTHEAL